MPEHAHASDDFESQLRRMDINPQLGNMVRTVSDRELRWTQACMCKGDTGEG
jgi:hypothetical protein